MDTFRHSDGLQCADRCESGTAEVFRAMREAEPGLVPIPAPAAAVARLFTGPGWQGRVGVISAMTDSFCSGCNRLRLTSDGMVSQGTTVGRVARVCYEEFMVLVSSPLLGKNRTEKAVG